ncbi:glycoside hydrolase family 26 protein [Streptomyces sp. CRN 30]|uniref:glycoside hydrolase family 26 protein n=1 Tax=Streptomyces sp. CRN 30 TaxID=3075613 RepID=UPI002A826180|nr:glycosyl hydrolase [Streptomyces sp. CRN 30]
MTPPGRRGILRWALATMASTATAGCAPSRTAPIGAGGEGAEGRTAPYVPFDVTWLIRPRGGHKYLGVSFAGASVTPGYLDLWSRKAGKAPNLLAQRFSWDEEFPADRVAAVWRQRMLPYLAWEPSGRTLRRIAAGGDDGGIRRTAATVRDLNVPVALAFAPGFNERDRPWGTRAASAGEFVAAWRRVHDLFQDTGVSNVVWVWSPTVTARPEVALEPYWPGDAYADWLGPVGRYPRKGPHTFDGLFGTVVKEARAFTRAPVLVAETAAPPGGSKAAVVRELTRAVATRDDVVGFVWLDAADRTDWRIDSGTGALDAFRRGVADPRFGFDVRRP